MSSWIRFPHLRRDIVVFTCEHDVWHVPLAGGRAQRITTGLGTSTHPVLSPDAEWVAFTGTEEGVADLYVVERAGGPVRRVTFGAAVARVIGWDEQGIVFTSAVNQPFRHLLHLYRVDPEGGPLEMLPFGPAVAFDERPDGAVVLGRHQHDLAWWKGYNGGRGGEMWVRLPLADAFQRIPIPTQHAAPQWVGDRLVFLAETTGDPQLHSCDAAGADLICHTDHEDLAVRHPTSDGAQVIYVHGGDLWHWKPAETPRPVECEVRSQRADTQRRFVSAPRYLEEVDVHPEGHSLVAVVRGRPFVLGGWEGPVHQLGARDGVRYGCARFITADQLLVKTDEGGIDRLQLLDLSGQREPPFAPEGMGRVVSMEVDPTNTRVAISDHMHQLWLLELSDRTTRLVATGAWHAPRELAWSHDGRWLAWTCATAPWFTRSAIRAVRADEPAAAAVSLTDGAYADRSPSFDPNGDHLYFVSARLFDPVRSEVGVDYGFVRGTVPFVITLRPDVPHPFHPEPSALVKPKSGSSDARGSVGEVRIELEGIADRVVRFPVADAAYRGIFAVGKGKVLLTREPLRGTLGDTPWRSDGPPPARLQLCTWDFTKQKLDVLTRVSSVRVGRDRDHMLLRHLNQVRLAPTRPEGASREALKKWEGATNRTTMSVNLQRIRVSVAPNAEWCQMLDEAWRLMREHFWQPGMGGVDWDAVRLRYRALLPRIATRDELSDLIWCMQGELRTSHAYERGGDRRRAPWHGVGRLGADVSWNEAAEGWRIDHLPQGESGIRHWSNPLRQPGSQLEVGDVITHVCGLRLAWDTPPERALVATADTPVEVRTVDKSVTVRPLRQDGELRYRSWVRANRSRVAEQSEQRVGYLHIPDMGPSGFAAFSRDYTAAADHDAVLVDVRGNRGGHVSPLLLARLARPHTGFKVPRWGRPSAIPPNAIRGPMVCLTNEHAGSDGDIFSHQWKRLGLGPLIGKRTWGGVVGILPRVRLVDRGITTQPEYSTWFDDVGYGLENRGTQPDVEVLDPPEQYCAGEDFALDRAVEILLNALAASSPDADLTRPEEQL